MTEQAKTIAVCAEGNEYELTICSKFTSSNSIKGLGSAMVNFKRVTINEVTNKVITPKCAVFFSFELPNTNINANIINHRYKLPKTVINGIIIFNREFSKFKFMK